MAQPAPFVFFGCVELRELLGLRARDERELMEQLERAPLGAVYYHTHSVFLRHYQITGAYPNDFANWVAAEVRDQVLAERLAVVDPFALETLEALREEREPLCLDGLDAERHHRFVGVEPERARRENGQVHDHMTYEEQDE